MLDKNWFKKHQKGLLFLLNAPIIKYWFRWVLRIRKEDCHLNVKISEILPNNFTFDKKLIFKDHIVFENGNREVYNPYNTEHKKWRLKYKIEKHLVWEMKTDFRTHNKYAKRLFFAFRYIWLMCHYWDILIANNFNPAWNLGFDTATYYPDADAESTTVDGQVWVSGENSTFSTLRSTAGSAARDNATEEAVYIAASSTTDQYSMLTRAPTLFDISGLAAGASISAATYSFWFWEEGNGLSGDNSVNSKVVLDDCSPASNTALQSSDFNIANWGGNDYGRSVQQDALTVSQYEDITINASGITFIETAQSGDGIVKFGMRYGWDFDNTTTGLTWASSAYQGIYFAMADYAGTTRDPKLVLTYTLPSGFISTINVI